MLGVLRRLGPTPGYQRAVRLPTTHPWLGSWEGSPDGWFPCSLVADQRVRHPAIPRRPPLLLPQTIRNGLPTTTNIMAAGGHAHTKKSAMRTAVPAPIRQVSSRLHITRRPTLVSHVYLLVSLDRPAPSGSTGTSRLCQGRLPPKPLTLPTGTQTALSFTRPLRQPSDEGLSPPFETTSASRRTF
jgi:hypothetical protein